MHHGLPYLATIACLSILPSPAAAQDGDRVPFAAVRRLFAERCYTCHGPDAAQRRGGPEGGDGLRLDTEQGLHTRLDHGVVVVPGAPLQSELIRRVTADGRERMPPVGKGAALTAAEVALLTRWIEQGAAGQPHWADVAPRRPPLPALLSEGDAEHPIDRFVRRRLLREGLQPEPAAARRTLVRRVALDLTGLPPTLEEAERFATDESPDAWPRLVDRLLASDAYGERWAAHWLDLARYADSAGYADDRPRTIWAYRDWVIRAFNENLPFDQFTVAQLAGDLLPEPGEDQLVATGFHRNTMTNSEGGTDDEEFRCAAVVDRVSTTMSVWMGATAGCAQCHSHKYDALLQSEFYGLYAFFNGTEDRDQADERPTLSLFSAAQQRDRDRWQAELTELERALDPDRPQVRAAAAAWQRGFPRNARFAEQARGAVHAVRLLSPAGDAAPVLEAALAPADEAPLRARYVRVTLPGPQRNLHLAEVQVFCGDDNLAPAGTARQSSTGYDAPAVRAVDGNTDGHFADARSTTHTATSDDPWWEVDLGGSELIERVVVWNRTDSNGVLRRLHDFTVQVLGERRDVLWQATVAAPPDPNVELRPRRARPVPLGEAFRGPGGAWQAIVRAPVAVPVGHHLEVYARGAGVVPVAVSTDAAFAAFAAAPAEVLQALVHEGAATEQTAARYVAAAPALAAPRARRDALQRRLREQKPYTTVPVLRARAEPRATHVHLRGDYRSPGEEVTAHVPAAFHPWPDDAPRDRLGLARWLVAAENPRTARVFVNRVWAELFGRGLVPTVGDFGVQGDPPSHPDLLDWLAVELVESGWDVKALLRGIVTSQTYRQRAHVEPALLQRDPQNVLLARGPRFRLSAEMVRDAALHASGLLSTKRFGPPVRPPRPNLGLRAAFGGSTDWQTSAGEDRYRRALYTTWRRSLPYPSMVTFDAPSREVCTVQRIRTNTPLQALVTLNDPVYVEAAQALARRMLSEVAGDAAARAAHGFALCLLRPPSAAERDRLVALHRDGVARFAAAPEQARAFATEPLGPAPAGADLADLAAWTLVANVLLNLDEFLVKG